MTTPLAVLTEPSQRVHRLRGIAKELALDIYPHHQVMQMYGVTDEEWERLARNGPFNEMLRQETEAWNSSLNAEERVKLKMFVLIETNIPTMQAWLIDKNFSDPAKVDVMKTALKAVNMGGGLAASMAGSVGEKVIINIDMGADKQLRVEHDVTPRGNLIEGEVVGAEPEA